MRLALRYCPRSNAIEIGQAFADHDHLGLVYPLSNRTSRKRKRKKVVKFTPWYAR